jgi:ADP-heptose:LPS heptosyltransferase
MSLVPSPHTDLDPLSAQPSASDAEVSAKLAALRLSLRQGTLTVERARWLSAWAAAQFWGHNLTHGRYLSDAVTLLCEIATQSDPALAKPAEEGIFSLLVERLSDSFNPDYCGLYDRLFVQVVDWCRRHPAGTRLNAELLGFGLHTAEDLLRRKSRLVAPAPLATHWIVRSSRIEQILVLSRVTLGADVAVTGTVIAHLKRRFPHATVVLLAPEPIRELFASDPRVRVRMVDYSRNGGLIERLDAWLGVLDAVRDETAGLNAGDYLLVDPDSRLTQLGIFPLMQDELRYFFFESRGYGRDTSDCIGALASRWAGETFGGPEIVFPTLSLADEDRAFAAGLRARLARAGASLVVTVNFGVGGNAQKQLSEDFEHALVAALINDGSFVLLAKGVGAEEVARSQRLIERLRAGGHSVVEFQGQESDSVPHTGALGVHVLAWEGRVGAYAALIGESDEYIGYDSGGQHIAAALGVPTIDIFVHNPFPLFMQRWRPYGPSAVHLVDATDQRLANASRDVLTRVLSHRVRR